jgi:hypothetical protein
MKYAIVHSMKKSAWQTPEVQEIIISLETGGGMGAPSDSFGAS